MASSSSTDCSICCDVFNNSTRKKTVCTSCHIEVCCQCVKTYILNTSLDPHCMSCKHEWNAEFLHQILPKTFLNTNLKNHVKKTLMDREKMLLPETQPYVEKELQIREMQTQQEKIHQEISKAYKLIATLRDTLSNNDRVINTWYSTHNLNNVGGGSSGSSKEPSKFVRACPKEGCKGYLSNKWICGICKCKVCKDCHEIVCSPSFDSICTDVHMTTEDTDDDHENTHHNNGHTCSPENVETAKLLMKDSKPCPSCSSLIFKISGCDQMWCTQCHTAFSWKTGRIETINVHNPHFYEWQRNQNGGVAPRVPGDVPCGGLVGLWNLKDKLKEYRQIQLKDVDIIMAYHRFVGHVVGWERDQYRPPNHQDIRNLNITMRIQWMLNEITEATWQKELHYRDRRNKFKKDIFNVFELCGNVGIDVFQKLYEEPLNYVEYTKELHKLIEYCNENFRKISKQYNYSTPFIKYSTHSRRGRYYNNTPDNVEDKYTLIEVVKKVY